jgi:excinuclease ABC subunit C
MPKRSKYKFSIEGKPLYPHIKLTREAFPRILATRIIANDDAEYFGAFLNRTNARILLDSLNRIFRLRSCDIEIDGTFNYPCTMYYKRRCVAPCVSDLADSESYEEIVAVLRIFLLNDRALFGSTLTSKIAHASEQLDFERAAKWRDMLLAAEAFWEYPRHSVWLDRTSDTITFRETVNGLDVFLISQQGRRVLGERIFSFENAVVSEAGEAISDVIKQFYRLHAPKEVRVPIPLPDKAELENLLQTRIGKRTRVVLLTERNRKVSTDFAVNRSSAELDVRRMIVRLPPLKLMQLLKQEFELVRTPERVTAIDVAHISGTDAVAASISWKNGRIDPVGSSHWQSDSSSELATMQRFAERLAGTGRVDESELFLIDGGQAQLGAALSADLPKGVSLVSAVKPSGDHLSIAYFLTARRKRVEFDISNEAHRLLQLLRDEAHDYANAVHRDTRDYANYYRMAEILPSLTESERRKLVNELGSIAKVSEATDGELSVILAKDRRRIAMADLTRYRAGKAPNIRPLVVPIRLQDAGGAAEDLRPIASGSFPSRS